VNLALLLVLLAGTGEAASPQEAEAVLETAAAFRDAAVGEAGMTPPEVHALRRLLRSPDGAERFRRLAARASPAGQIYALCGLFFLDPQAFTSELARLRRLDVKVTRQEGCVVFESTIASTLAEVPGTPVMSRSGSFREWLRRGFRASLSDIPGGSTCYRLRYGPSVLAEWLEDPDKAPDDGPPPGQRSR